jgi:hypothetical protein
MARRLRRLTWRPLSLKLYPVPEPFSCTDDEPAFKTRFEAPRYCSAEPSIGPPTLVASVFSPTLGPFLFGLCLKLHLRLSV